MAIGLISGIGAATGLAQALVGARQSKKAKEALEGYQRQRLTNVADELSVYTRGAELQREESGRFGASAVDALQQGGSRNLIGGLGRVQQGQQRMNRQIAADLETQQARIDQVRAQDERRIQQMQEQREQQDINALSSQYNAGQQQMWQGIGGIAQSGISGLQMIQEQEQMDKYGDWFGGSSKQLFNMQQQNQNNSLLSNQPQTGSLLFNTGASLTPNRVGMYSFLNDND